jgi:hypothetical protein
MAIADHIKKDSPTNNFATLNPLFINGTETTNATSSLSLSEGNLKLTADSNYSLANGTFTMRTGKWYWETFINTNVNYPMTGITHGTSTGENSYIGYDPSDNVKGISYSGDGSIYGDSSGDGTHAANNTATGLLTYSTNDIIGCFFDADIGSLKFFKNDTLIHTESGINRHDWHPATSAYNSGINIVNFGQDSSFGGNKTTGSANASDGNGIGDFYYDPPTVSGTKALALCTANLPDFTSTVDDDNPEDYFKCVKYTGVANSAADFTVPVGFQSDLIWIKRLEGNSHNLFDSVRGFGFHIISDYDGEQRTGTRVSLVNTSGFTVDTSSQNAEVNISGGTFISWNWKAGGAPNSTDIFKVDNVSASALDAFGSASNYTLTPTRASIGPKQGFSIIKYVGAGTSYIRTIPHGLSATPDFITIKNLDDDGDWITWFQGFGADNYLRLNTTGAKTTSSNAWGGSPNNNTFSVYASGAHNTSGDNYIAYCWRSVEGYSAFGTYEGNADADGPFVHTGFKPAWLMIKNIDTSSTTWDIYDNVREPFNDGAFNSLSANSSASEGNRPLDFLSNGFKIREPSSSSLNAADTYIYMAFAEQPTKFANAR